MGDSMPRPKDLHEERDCVHPYGNVRQRSASVTVSGKTIKKYEVMFCEKCDTIVEEV